MNKNISEIVKEKQCAGCFGCYNFCPNNAIRFEYDSSGFLIPIIKEEKCTNCSYCLEICPIYNLNYNNMNFEKPRVYSCWSKHSKIRYKSSSGGIFYEIASYILDNEGVIYGVGWDNNNQIKHIRITRKEDLILLIGSKYLQSYVGFSFKEAIEDLKNDRLVLFSGTPCQIAVLKNYFKGNDPPNLISLEILCHGVPSKIVFDEYLKYKSKKNIIKEIRFRDKRYSWKDYSINIIFKNGKEYTKHHSIDEFLYGYSKNYFLNHSCYDCKFAQLPRNADITLGDFWTQNNKYNKQLLGVSLLIVNNQKSFELIKDLPNIMLFREDLNDTLNGNPRIVSGTIKEPEIRKVLINDLKKRGFKYIIKKYYSKPFIKKRIWFYFDNNILRFIPNFLKIKISQIFTLLKAVLRIF